jgi:hypothetical protein
MAIQRDNKPVDTRIKQTRRGYATPRRIRELRIGPGNEVGGWGIDDGGAFTSDEDANGFRIILDAANSEISFDGGVFIRNTATPFSGTGGMTIEHGDGVVVAEVSGDGDGLGSQQVLLRNAESTVYVGIQRNLAGTTRVIMGGLPTSSVGLSSGMIWNDSGTLKIV